MKKIIGKEKALIDLLANKKYTIHYYQREYRWEEKQIEELIDDLTEEFNEHYNEDHDRSHVERYGHYYLGSIVLSSSDNENAIIDGQQRLTSITLLLIYLNNLQADRRDKVNIDHLIFSERYGRKSFNIQVEEREQCLNALFNNQLFDPRGQSESVQNIYARYKYIEEVFPEQLKKKALPFFIEWLMYQVFLVEITAQTEQDAHKIFVSMNDRGLSLTPTEMLKGYLLSEIADDNIRNKANSEWKKKILELKDIGKDEDADFFKYWLRAQNALTIRETKKDAEKRDFDIIGGPFHKWVRENSREMGLQRSHDFENFVLQNFIKFANAYKKIKYYSENFNKEFEYVYYNANRKFTLQYLVILAAIDPQDNPEDINKKIKMVSCFLDQYIAIRVFNFKVVDYSTIKNAMFNLSKRIRRLSVQQLAEQLFKELDEMGISLEGIDHFYLNQFTNRYMLHILSRLTHYIEIKSGMISNFEDYVSRTITNPYDVEHIWANHFEDHRDEFSNEEDFNFTRNKFGALLILPRDKNRSFQDNTYEEKLPKYYSENLLARTLNNHCYQNNPQFLRFKQESKLLFKPMNEFKKQQIFERQQLYKAIAKKIWNPLLIKSFV
ncbi:DUF262 domain-containing protein [Bacillus thuringiensis]|nr:DUF262 domain-containing protein [Bacillus thuringiensis]